MSSSSFQNISSRKGFGVLTELVQFMFENPVFDGKKCSEHKLPPVYVYAVETAIQMTLTELNENLREIYIETYTQKEACEYIQRETAKELYQIFYPISRAWQRDFLRAGDRICRHHARLHGASV